MKHSCIISRELYALIKRMRKQRIPGPFLQFFEWAWVQGYTQYIHVQENANSSQYTEQNLRVDVPYRLLNVQMFEHESFK